NLAGKRHPGRNADDVRLGDTELEVTVRELLSELRGHHARCDVAVHGDHRFVLRTDAYQRITEGFSRRSVRHDARISSIACLASSGLGVFPCHFVEFSMKDTPFPLTVCAMTTVGLPFVCSASSNASSNARRSWPSHSITCQENARHLSGSGSSVGKMSFTDDVCWIPLLST